METLETAETLAEGSSQTIKPHEPKTLETPSEAPDPSSIGDEANVESRVSGLEFRPDSETQVLEPDASKEALETVESGGELGLGLAPDGSSEVSPQGDLEKGKSEESKFRVGDFVWGKIKSHPWWPGQVYDPSQASENAEKAHRKDHQVLVAYFGDGTFAWCDPSQLKPFKECFHEMVKQSSSKSFTSAVKGALDEIGRCLELEMTCYCEPAEARAGLKEGVTVPLGRNGELCVTNYVPTEFLERVRDIALDVLIDDMLEVTMLRSWVFAFSRAKGKHHGITELVQKTDLDLMGDLNKDPGEEDCWVTGSGVVKGPEVSEKLHQRKKKRSMAELIAGMDLDTVEVNDDEGEEAVFQDDTPLLSSRKNKKSENFLDKGSDVENDDVGAEEGIGSGRRERKKSKYLSPPYTYIGGYSKRLASPKSAEVKMPWKVQEDSLALLTGSPSILEGNSEASQKEEDMKSPVFNFDNISTDDMLSEFHSTALNVLHLKWNRASKTVRGFFAKFRSSVYSSGSDFENYQKHLDESGGINSISPKKEVADGSGKGKSGSKRKKGKDEGNGETKSDLGHEMTDRSEQGKGTQKKKMRKDGANGVTPVGTRVVNSLEDGKSERKRKKRTDGADGESLVVSGHELIKCSEEGKVGQKTKKSEVVGNGKTLNDLGQKLIDKSVEGKSGQKKGQKLIDKSVEGKSGQKKKIGKDENDLGHKLIDKSVEGKSGQKRKIGKDESNGKTLVDLNHNINNCLEESKSEHKRKKRKDGTHDEPPAALLLTFAPGIPLPSKDDLISAFSKYGMLNEPATELLNDSGCARVVFVKSTDAEKALNSSDKTGIYGPTSASYRLRYLPRSFSSPSPSPPVPKPPLPYIRKSLERMISTLTGSSLPEKDVGSTDVLKPEARENLVGEMQGLLKKVNKMLTGPAAATSS